MIEDEALVPEEPLEDDPDLEVDGVKKPLLPKDLIDDEVESLEDLEEEELDDDEEPFDDIDEQ